MKTKQALCGLLIISLGLSFTSCNDDEVAPEPEKASWIVSTLSPEGSFYPYGFMKGDDGQLYAVGSSGTDLVFNEYADGSWTTIATVQEPVVVSFTIYNDAVYYSTYNSIKRAKGSEVETIMNAAFSGLEVYKDKLILTGSPIEWNGNEYTIMSFDGNTFTTIDQGTQGGGIVKVNDKLFIG